MPYTFKVKDLMVNLGVAGAGGGVMLPVDDGPIPTPLTPKTPIISAMVATSELRAVQPLVKDALKVEDGNWRNADQLALAAAGGLEGSPALRAALGRMDRVVLGAAVLAQGGAGMPNPDCGGTSLETIPTPLTPYVQEAKTMISRSQIPALRAQVEQVLVALEKAELELTPKGREVEVLRGRLEGALEDLKQRKG